MMMVKLWLPGLACQVGTERERSPSGVSRGQQDSRNHSR